MTVVNPDSIAGITSVTSSGTTLEFYDVNGNLLDVSANLTGELTVGTGATISSPGANSIDFETNGSEKVRILSGGQVNIGGNFTQTNAPLAVTTNANSFGYRLFSGSNSVCDILNNDSAGNAEIRGYYNNNSGSRGEGFRLESNGETFFNPGGNTGLNIKSSGAVGINESNPTGKLTITNSPQGFVDDSAQPQATFLIKHGTSGSNRRWVGIGASLTGAWIQSSSPGGTGLAAPLWINKGGGDVTLGNDRLIIKNSGSTYDTGSKTITGGTNLAIQNFRVKGIWSGSPSIGKEIELISGYDGSVKMAAIGYNLTNTNTGSTYGGDLVFHTQPLYGSPTTPIPESMRISSSGYVTQSKQPCFHVSLEGHKNATQDPLVFTDVRVNTGSHYSSSTGKFTAPVAGRYLFFFMGIKNSNNKKINTNF